MTTPPTSSLEVKQAVSAYAQSEKVKSGLIWICQVAEQVATEEGPAKKQGLTMLTTLARLVAAEADLAARMSGETGWYEIGKRINKSLVMIQSGVPQETSYHLTQALTKVTQIGGQAAEILKANDLF